MRKIKPKFNITNVIVVLVTTIFCVETIGYALFNQLLNLNGVATFNKDGIIEIKSIEVSNQTNAYQIDYPSYEDMDVNFSVGFNVEDLDATYEIKYLIKVQNDSVFDYVLAGNNSSVVTNVEDNSEITFNLEGINYGDTIKGHSSAEFYLVIGLIPMTENTEYNVYADYEPDIDLEKNANLIGALSLSSPKTGDLRGANTLAHFTADVINTYTTSKNFSLKVNSNIFELVDSTSMPLGSYTIAANSEETYDFYVKVKNDAILPNDTEKVTVYLESDGLKTQAISTLTLSVDKNYVKDVNPPQISNVKAVQNSEDKSVTVTWNGTDEAAVQYYTVIVYKNNTAIGTYNTTADEEYMDLTLDAGTYYFKVYGTDSSGNTATNTDINNATTQGVCAKSSNVTFKWYYNVTYSLTNLTKDTITQAKVNESLTLKITASGNYSCPQRIEVRMNNTTLTSDTDYTYTRSNNNKTGTIKINNVTGDITVTATASGGGICLVKGTKVKLSNNTYKNIEDVNYYDLLEVWDYDNGTTTEEYPIWIENTDKTDSYTKITFSDGSTLNAVGYHGIYNFDLNRFVSVDNNDEFYIGCTVAKVENNKIVKIKVTNIEKIEEEINYYHVVSSRYYNIIANDFITTDGKVELTNIFTFDENIKWQNRDDSFEGISYDSFKDIVPYYMYKGMRMSDAYFLLQNGMKLNDFKMYLLSNQLNEKMLKEYPNINGKRMFKVSINDQYIFVPENTILTINKDNLLNTLDNKVYNNGDKILITNSIHFKDN